LFCKENQNLEKDKKRNMIFKKTKFFSPSFNQKMPNYQNYNFFNNYVKFDSSDKIWKKYIKKLLFFFTLELSISHLKGKF